MATASDLVQETRRLLNAGLRQEMNTLAASVDAATTTVPLTFDPAGAQSGAYLAVGLEVMYVWAADPASKTVTVRRGVLGSTPAPHTADDLVYVNPRFTDFDIFAALNHDLADLCSPSAGLYRVGTLDITPIAGRWAYDLTGASDLLDVLAVDWREPSGPQFQHWIRVGHPSVLRGMPTTDFPSGVALNIPGGDVPIVAEMRLRYKAPFTAFTALTDDVAATGLPDTAADLPPLGAALRVAAGLPVRRTQTDAQGDTRRASEVSTNDLIQAPAVLRAQRAARIAAERTRLEALWPVSRHQ